MTTGNSGNACSGLEGLAHYRELLIDGAPAALFGLGQNFNRFHVRAGLKHRRKTTSKFKRYLVSGFRGGRPTLPAGTRIWLAAGVTDMRCYAELPVMRSWPAVHGSVGAVSLMT